MEKNNTSSGNSLADFSAQITAVEATAPSIVAIDARPRVATTILRAKRSELLSLFFSGQSNILVSMS